MDLSINLATIVAGFAETAKVPVFTIHYILEDCEMCAFGLLVIGFKLYSSPLTFFYALLVMLVQL